MFLKVKSTASQEDNPNLREATTGVFADNDWKSMKVGIATLESMGDFDIVDENDSMNVIDSTCAFKCKRYTDRSLKTPKARFFARGD